MIALMPHGSCFLWNPYLTALHAINDLAIALAYFAITGLLTLFFHRNPGLWMGRQSWIAFGFIGWCGLGHLLAAWNIWHHNYWFEGLIKFATSSFSWAGLISVIVLAPKAQALCNTILEERNYQRILETAVAKTPHPMAIAIFDKEMRYIQDFPKWRALYGLEESIAGKSHYEVFQELPAEWIEQHRLVLEQGLSFYEEEGSWFVRPDGVRECIIYGIAPWMTADKDIGGLVAISSNVTKLKMVEESLNCTVNDLQRSNAELSEFGYVISHDLRSPLRTVRGFLELLYPEHFDVPDLNLSEDEKAELARDIVNEYKRLNQLVQDILSWSKVGKDELTLGRIDVVPIIRQIIDAMKADIQASGASIAVHERTFKSVIAHPSHLQQIFQNLIANAIKFSHPGQSPCIAIYARRLETGFLTISVQDNGIGLDTQKFGAEIFRFRYRLHHEEYEGSGMGLAICQKIVRHLGGRMWVDSAPNQGARFSFTLKV